LEWVRNEAGLSSDFDGLPPVRRSELPRVHHGLVRLVDNDDWDVVHLGLLEAPQPAIVDGPPQAVFQKHADRGNAFDVFFRILHQLLLGVVDATAAPEGLRDGILRVPNIYIFI